MRLTLRTLLAYLDENLRPEQSEELETKIKQSEPAQQLIAKIRDVQQRVRLGAPSLHGRGVGGDPNTVAEYLDNRLRSEKTGEIEKICMESDMQLAEVAACHQILSQILGRPLQSAPELRQRLYGIGELELTEGQPHADADFVRPNGEQAPAAATVAAADSGAPSYGAWYYFLVGALALSITLVVLAAGTYLMGGFNSPSDEVADGDERTVPVVPVVPNASGADDAETPGVTVEERGPVGDGGNPPKEDGDASVDEGGPEIVMDDAAPPPPGAPTDDAASEDEGGPEIVSDDAAPPAPAVTVDVPPAAPEGGKAVGTVANVEGSPNLVAIVDEQNADALRVAAGGEIVTGESYVTFPLFESLVLASPFHFRFVDDSQWGFDPTAEGQPLTLRLEQGNVRIVSDQPATLDVRFNGHMERIKFSEPATELAIQVMLQRTPGDDPRTAVIAHVAEFYLLKGKATLETPSPPVDLAVGKPMRWTDAAGLSPLPTPAAVAPPATPPEGEAVAVNAVLPAWIGGESRVPMETRAVAELLATLPLDRSLKLSLTEATADKREEMQAIAAWALCSLEYFDPALQSFDDPEQRSYWRNTLRAIRRDFPLSQGTATSLHGAILNMYPQSPDAVWAMLVGYSPAALESGGAADLVANLDDVALPVRALAFLNLFEITDITHTYRPEVAENRRRSAVQRWKSMLDAGEIRYATPPVAAATPQDSAATPAAPADIEPASTSPALPDSEEAPAPPPADAEAAPPAEEPSGDAASAVEN